MTFLKAAIITAADSATTASLTDSKASCVAFNGGAGEDTLFVQGDYNELAGGLGDDLLFSEGNCNDIYGDDPYKYNYCPKGCCLQSIERPEEGGNDEIYSYGNLNFIAGGVGEDYILTQGDQNYVDDQEGLTTLRNFGENNYVSLADGTHDIVSIGSNTEMKLGDGAHKILVAGLNNKITTGDGAFKLIHVGDIELNGGDVKEDDNCSTEYNRLIETFLRLATKVEVEQEYTDMEYELYQKYAGYADMIANYVPPTTNGCNCIG